MDLARRAQALEIAGRYRELRAMGESMVKARPDWSLGHYFLGSAGCGMGMLDEAERSIRKAIARDDKRAGFFIRLGEVLNRLGHREDALGCAVRAIELDGDNPKVVGPAAVIRWLGGDLAGAYRMLDDAIGRGIVSPKLRIIHAQLGAELGHAEEGIAALRGLLREHDDGRGLERLVQSGPLSRPDWAVRCVKPATTRMRPTGSAPIGWTRGARSDSIPSRSAG